MNDIASTCRLSSWFGMDAEAAARSRASRVAARAAFDARRTERWFLRKISAAGGAFRTVAGKVNRLVTGAGDTWEVWTERSTAPNAVNRLKVRAAMRELYAVRTVTRKALERFSMFSSALMGLLWAVFEDIAKIVKSASGLVRLTLSGFRFYCAGMDRAAGDMAVAADNGARVILLSYYHLRDDTSQTWRAHVLRLRLRVLLDSGAFSAMEAAERGKSIEPLRVTEYAAFIARHRDVLAGWMNLDVSGDAVATAMNSAYLRGQGLPPIEVWHSDQSLTDLDALVAQGHDVIAIGKTAKLPQAERRAVFARIFERHPAQNFHGLGLSSELLFAFPWFSADSTAWMLGRMYGTLIDAGVQSAAPAGMTRREALAYNVLSLTGHEARIGDDGAGVDYDPATMQAMREAAAARAGGERAAATRPAAKRAPAAEQLAMF